MKKLEPTKEYLDEVTKLKAKFEVAKAKKKDLDKRASTASVEVAILRSLEEVEDGMKVR